MRFRAARCGSMRRDTARHGATRRNTARPRDTDAVEHGRPVVFQLRRDREQCAGAGAGCVFATGARDRSPHRHWRRATGRASRNRHARVLSWPPPYTPYRAACLPAAVRDSAWSRVAPGRFASGPACAGHHIGHAQPVPFERSGAAACFRAAARPPGCRTWNLRPGAGFPRKIRVLAAKSAFARRCGNSHV
jgi:hypothetical protein